MADTNTIKAKDRQKGKHDTINGQRVREMFIERHNGNNDHSKRC